MCCSNLSISECWGLSFYFSHKYRRVCKIGRLGFCKKRGVGRVSLIFILIFNLFQCYRPLSVWCVCVRVCVCVLFISTISISIVCVFHRSNLVLQYLINRYMTFTNLQKSNFWKEKTLWKVNYINELFVWLYSGWTFSRLLTDVCGAEGRPQLHKICHTYPTMVKLSTPYVKKIQKNIWIT